MFEAAGSTHALIHALKIVRRGGTIVQVGTLPPEVPIPAMTDKDRRHLAFATEHGSDWIALSFIQRPEDIAEAKKITRGRPAIMAKIEETQAVHRLTGWAVEHGIELLGLSVSRASLEDVYLQLTSSGAGDE